MLDRLREDVIAGNSPAPVPVAPLSRDSGWRKSRRSSSRGSATPHEHVRRLVAAVAATGGADRVSIPPGPARRRRGCAGCICKSVYTSDLPRGVPLRGVVYAHSHQSLSRSAEGAVRRLRWSVRAPYGQALTPEPAAPQQTPEERCCRANAGNGSWRRSTSFQSVSGSCSRCVRSPNRARTRSARRSASVKPPCECISFERCGSCAACSRRSDEHAQKSSLRRPAH